MQRGNFSVIRWRGVLAIGLAVCVFRPGPARAFANDPVLSDLGAPYERRSLDAVRAMDPLAQERFARFVTELALSVSPLPAGLASSVGAAGFELSFSGDLAFINSSQKFSTGDVSDVWTTEEKQTGALFVPTLHFRKGLPLSLEVGTDVTYVSFSQMMAASGSVKWSLFEGFQWWPELAVRVFATVLIGAPALNLASGGWDVGGSYRVPLAGGAELGLYGGYQRIGVSASTNSIDFIPGTEDPQRPATDDAVFSPLSFGSNLVEPQTAFGRIYFGAQVRVGVLVVGLDAGVATGQNRITGGHDVKYDTRLWKGGLRAGVLF